MCGVGQRQSTWAREYGGRGEVLEQPSMLPRRSVMRAGSLGIVVLALPAAAAASSHAAPDGAESLAIGIDDDRDSEVVVSFHEQGT
jgi:hypothetical protein